MSTRRRIVGDRLYAHFVTVSVYRRRRLLDLDQAKRIVLGVLSEELLQCSALKYYSFEIHKRKKVEEKLAYIHANPVRAGLVERSTDWRWSSAWWYEWRQTVGVPIDWVE